jgi:hypothetical protein
MVSCRRPLMQIIRLACSRALANAGNNKPIRRAMIAITTSNSTSVNPTSLPLRWACALHLFTNKPFIGVKFLYTYATNNIRLTTIFQQGIFREESINLAPDSKYFSTLSPKDTKKLSVFMNQSGFLVNFERYRRRVAESE